MGEQGAGPPERGHTPGVEVTTGPLGQGFANAVGMAMGEVQLATRYNRPGHAVVDHHTYVLVGDGDLMEGVAAEATSLAGHLRLGKLVCLYDDNRVTLSAGTDMAFSEDRAARFAACGWHTVSVADGNDVEAIVAALQAARSEASRPSLILVRTHIGYGSPHKQDSFEAHGSPLGVEEVRLGALFVEGSRLGDFNPVATGTDDLQGADSGGWSGAGRNLHFGVREHAMGAIVNGLAAHGGFIPYGATFLIFCDYMRPAIRLAALMRLQVIYVFTHDSLAVGEDGPTHQPVEQLASLRAIPGLTVVRPADANETAVASRLAVESRQRPVLLALTRQVVPTIDRSRHAGAEGLRRGAYGLIDAIDQPPALILIASGSEVALITGAAERLRSEGIAVRCVSMPSWDLFDAQPQSYRDEVLPPTVSARLAVELGVTQGWHRYVGDRGDVLGVDRFGASAPADILLREYGFSVENVAARAKSAGRLMRKIHSDVALKGSALPGIDRASRVDRNAPESARTMPIGRTQPLYILPFDHRASFVSGLFGWTGALEPRQSARVTAAKRVIYDGFAAAVAGGVDKDKAGILVDEHFGAGILRNARRSGIITCAPAEKSGQDEFDFEFGDNFARHVEASAPDFCKVLVRYNPEGNAAMNRRQVARLRRLSEYLVGSPSRFMFELLVPATPPQLDALAGDTKTYDREVRPELMRRALRELQDAGVEADVWKVEGLESRSDCEAIVATARRDDRASVGCIVLGRGEDEQQVRAWLKAAAGVTGFIGFAVGRTTFSEPLVALRDEKITREAAVAEIARRYRQWCDVFELAKAEAGSLDANRASAADPPTRPET